MREQSPAYVQVAQELRRLAMSQPLASEDPLPPEGQLTERFRVSRGTLRRATEELVREGLLSSEPGRGTYVRKQAQVRVQMQEILIDIAYPDSRFHLDVGQYVPDFAGSIVTHDVVTSRPEFEAASIVFIAPDNSLQALIVRALDAGKRVLVPTYGMRRGMVLLDPEEIPTAVREFAATLDGLERLGQRLDVDDLAALGSVDLLVTGAIAFSTSGVHVGTGRAYLDIEWAILAQLGLVTRKTPIFGVVHQAQVLEADLVPGPTDINVDLIITPDGAQTPSVIFPRPEGIDWPVLDPSHYTDIAYLAQLRLREEPGGKRALT